MQRWFVAATSPLWEQALSRVRHDFYHLARYVELEALREGGEAFAFIANEGGHWFFVPVIQRAVEDRGLVDGISPYGYPGPIASTGAPAEFVVRAIRDFVASLKERGVVSMFVRLHPLIGVDPTTLEGSGLTVQHGNTVYIDLRLSPEELTQQTRTDHRYGVRKAIRVGFACELDDGWQHFDDFLEIYAQTMDRVGADKTYYFDRAYFLGLRDALQSRLSLFVVKKDSQVAAAGLFTRCSGVTQFHLSGTRTEFLRSYPSKVLLDHVRTWAKREGMESFHLGGGLGASEDSLFDFKAGFSPLRSPFYSWRLVADPERYAELVAAWEARHAAAADPSTGFFPAYRKPA